MATIHGTSGDDSLTGTSDDDVMFGAAGNDTLQGADGGDTLVGGDDNDSLFGGTGAANALQGGLGDDNYYVAAVGDSVIEFAGEGNDTVRTALATYNLSNHVERLLYTGSGAFIGKGNALANVIIGGAGNDSLDGGEGVDTLVGGGGNDSLFGGAGAANALQGGLGDDNYYVSAVGDSIIEFAGEGNDTVRTALTIFNLSNNVERLLYTGSGAFTGKGNALANVIIGGAGNDSLDGGDGVDTLVGGGGNDSLFGGAGAANALQGGLGDDNYYVAAVGDSVIEFAGEGNDTVRTALASYNLSNHVERLLYTGSGAFTGKGNALANVIIGGAGNDSLDGGDGVDTLVGGGGNDSLFGGTGAANALQGGLGNDIYNVAAVGDSVIEFAGEGTDAVRTALASFTLSNNVENLFFTGTGPFIGTGNALNNVVIGGAGDDTLNGADGTDTLVGSGGNDSLLGGTGAANALQGGIGDDTYYVSAVGDSVVEFAGEGGDTVRAAVSSYTLAANVEDLIFVGSGAFTGNGNLLDNLILGGASGDQLSGHGGADTLQGGNGGDTLSGGDGADSLSGGAGVDSLTGGTGSDSYVFDAALGGGNIDNVTDFELIDRIVLGGGAGQPFAALASGGLDVTAFRIGSAAADLDDRIIYNSLSGALLYDADGSGGGAAVQFATLDAGLNLDQSNFLVAGPANNPVNITSGTTATIAENSAVSTIVYQVVANDPNGDTIVYRLSGSDASFFTIDANGAIRLISPADFESRQSYDLRVTAEDSGGSGEFIDLDVTVTDVEDTAGQTPSINETAAANNSVFQAQLIDRGILQPSTNPILFNDDLPSVVIRGAISTGSPNADIDFYQITLTAGEQLILDIDNAGNGLDALIRIYDASGNLLGLVDDSLVDPGSEADHPPDGTQDSFFPFRAPTSGTYFFSVESWGEDSDNGPGSGTTTGTYDLNVSIGPIATPAQILEEDIQALIDSEGWPDPNPNLPGFNLTYAFPNSPSDYPANTAEAQDNFEQFNPVQRAATSQMLEHMATFSNLVFTQLFDNQESSATLRYAMSDVPDVAFAYLPGGPLGGTAWFRNSPIDGRPTPSFDNPVAGSYSWMSILHETGHALGLKHGHEAPAVSFDRDSVEYTVMTYRSYPGQQVNGYTNETWGFPTTMMALDIAALQRLYGANFAFNAGNNVYTWSPSSGQMSVDGVGGLLPGGGNRVFMTVWDGGGIDTYDLSNYGNTVRIDLRPGEHSLTSQTQLANLGEGHFARGNVFNAFLFNGDTRSLIENAIAGSGDDTLVANQARNQLTGGGGSDTFRWHSAADAGLGAQADVVTDFVRGADRIDLSPIDAIAGSPANDGFTFIGTNAFTDVAGQLRWQLESGGLRIQGDIDGNGVADLEIFVDNVTSLDGTDFFF